MLWSATDWAASRRCNETIWLDKAKLMMRGKPGERSGQARHSVHGSGHGAIRLPARCFHYRYFQSAKAHAAQFLREDALRERRFSRSSASPVRAVNRNRDQGQLDRLAAIAMQCLTATLGVLGCCFDNDLGSAKLPDELLDRPSVLFLEHLDCRDAIA
jgi:hypothetical protein